MSHVSAPASLFLLKTLTPIEVMVIQSDQAHAQGTLAAFRSAGLADGVHPFREGQDALNYLRRAGPYENARVPDLIFLDLSQPKIAGLTALKLIRSTPALMHIPVVVAADADDPEFIQDVHAMNGNGFIQKPAEMMQFLRSLESCFDYWVSVVMLSSQDASAAATS